MIRSSKPMSLALMASAAVLLSACDTFKEKIPLSGKRETILTIETTVSPDPTIEKTAVVVPPKERNRDWSQSGGNPTHRMPNLTLANPLRQTWSTSIGYGSSEDHRLTSGPVMAADRVYACDAMGKISAVNTNNGAIVWSVDVLAEGRTAEALGGGVAYDDGIVYGTTAFGELVALQAQDGKILWRKFLGAPSRVAPTIASGKVYVLTINNETQAFHAKTGESLWTHSGISEAAGILGGASPAVSEGIVISAYSSGEVFAFDAHTGQPIWGELINPAIRIDSVASIAHIRARPVIEGGTVYLISHGGQMVALDLKTGARLWQREIGGIRSPAVLGDSIFVVTNDTDLVCVKKSTGQIHWAASLPKIDAGKKPILWAGPIMAGDSLILTGSNGQIIFASPQNGKILKTLPMLGGSTISPIVADGSLYILTDDQANLVKYSAGAKKEE